MEHTEEAEKMADASRDGAALSYEPPPSSSSSAVRYQPTRPASRPDSSTRLRPPPSAVQNIDNDPSITTADTTALLPTSSSRQASATQGGGGYQTFPRPSSSPYSSLSTSSSRPADGRGDSSGFSDSAVDPTKVSNKQKQQSATLFVYVLTFFAGVGGLLFGYDTGIVSGSMLLIQPYFNLSTVWQEAIVSGTVATAAIFSLLAGVVCDWIGRKTTIVIASIVFTAGAVVMGAAPSEEVLLVGRVIVGAGIGFASMSVPVYIAEVAPSNIRGILVSLNQLMVTVGILLSSIIAGAFSQMRQTGWRYMLGLGCVPGIVQFIGFMWLPESPRWLVSKGRMDEARKVLRLVRWRVDVEDELQMFKHGETYRQTGCVLGQMLQAPYVRRALFVGCGLQMFQQLCGINTVIYYSATILKEAGFPPPRAIWLVCIPFSVNFLATFLGLWAVDRAGRRMLLLLSFLGVVVALLVLSTGFLLSAEFSPLVNTSITVRYANGSAVSDQCQGYKICEDCVQNKQCGYCYDLNHPELATCLLAKRDEADLFARYGRCENHSAQEEQTDRVRWTYGFCHTDYDWLAVVGLALFVFSFAPGLGPMPWTVNSEIYPMWARGTGMSVATTVNWTCNLIVSFTFLSLMQSITKYGTFLLFTGISVLGIIFTLVFVPETKHRTLEEAEELFGGPHQQQYQPQSQQGQKEPDSQRLSS